MAALSTESPERTVPSIRQAFGHTLSTRAVIFAVSMVNSILVARALGPAGRGHLAILLTATTFLNLLLSPLGAANTVLVGSHPGRVRALLHNSCLGVLLAVLLMSAALLLPRHLILSLTGDVPGSWIALLIALSAAQICYGSLSGLLLGRQEFYLGNYLALFSTAATLILNGLLLIWLKAGVAGALTASVLSCTVASILLFRHLYKARHGKDAPGRLSFPLFGAGLRIGGRAIASNLPTLLMLRIDIFLLWHFLDAASVGIYTVAVSLGEMVLTVGNTLNGITFAKAASQQGIDDGVIRSAKFSLLISLLFWLTLAITGRWVIPFAYGTGFNSALAPCLVVMLGICSWSFCTPLVGYIIGKAGYPPAYVIAASVGAAVNILLNLLLIPLFGVLAAAVSTAVSYSLTAIIVVRIFGQMTGRRWATLLFLDAADLRGLRDMFKTLQLTSH